MKERIPDYQTLMFPVLDYLKDNQQRSIQEVLDHLSNKFQLSQDELRILVPSGQQPLFRNRVTWSISYLKNAGLMKYVRRGVYQITETGQKVLQEGITTINTAYLKKFEAFKVWQSELAIPEDSNKPTHEEGLNTNKTPEEIVGENFKKINDKLTIELLDTIKQRTPAQFEKFVLELLSSMGYGGVEEKNFEVVGQSGDNGIDGIIYQDKLGIDRIYVQAKKWNDNKVHSKDIRDFIGSLSLRGTNKGVFITTSEFTADALQTVQKNPQNIIILIDGKKLCDFAMQYNVGVQVKTKHEIKNIDLDFFEDL